MATRTARGSLLEGPITPQLVAFGLPLLVGNLFQQLYTAVDSVVVGRFVGTEALAAVGNTTSLIFLFISFFMGISTGANVVIAQFIGAGRRDRVRSSISTSLFLSLASSVVLTVLFLLLIPQILRWMLTPADIYEMTRSYLQIYMLSLPAVALYNTGTAVLRSMGDSRRPLYFLIASSLLNVVLDLLFVCVLRMGVEGAAIASVIAQYISVALVGWVLWGHIGEHSLQFGGLTLDRAVAGRVLALGMPSALQNCVISLSNVLFQSQVNIFGAQTIAGYGAGNRISNLIYMPIMAFGMATTTFVGQNWGAGQYARIRRGTRISVAIGGGATLVAGVAAYLLRLPLLRLFTDDPEVLAIGSVYMLIFAIPCVIWALPHIYGCALVGMGKSLASMLIILFNMCGVRLIWIFSLLPFWRDVRVVFLSFPVSWATGGLFMLFYYIRWMRKTARADHNAPQTAPDELPAKHIL